MSSLSTPEAVRATHLSHEASIKSVGALYYFAAITTLLTGIVMLVRPGTGDAQGWIVAAILVIFGVLYFQMGRWFRELNPKAKVPGTLLAGLGLLAFPIGTLINAYILYLIHSKKGATVFSESYKDVIAATPSMKYKTSMVVWVLLGLVVVLIIAMIGFAISSQ